jgi:hypothetical protein
MFSEFLNDISAGMSYCEIHVEWTLGVDWRLRPEQSKEFYEHRQTSWLDVRTVGYCKTVDASYVGTYGTLSRLQTCRVHVSKKGWNVPVAEHYSAASTAENVQVPELHNPAQKNDVVRGRRLNFLWRSSILGFTATEKDEEEVGFDRGSVFVIVALQHTKMDIVLHQSSCSGGGSSDDDDVGVGSSSPSLRSSDEVASMQSNKKQALLNKFLSSKSS